MLKGLHRDFIAGIRHLLRVKRAVVERRVVRTEKPGRLPDVCGAESSARAIIHAGIERDAEDGDIDTLHVLDTREPRGRC